MGDKKTRSCSVIKRKGKNEQRKTKYNRSCNRGMVYINHNRRMFAERRAPMREERLRGEEYRTTLVCIDSYQNATLTGQLYNPYMEEGKSFQSAIQFLTEMEQLLERLNFPAAFSTARMFSTPNGCGAGPPPAQHKRGAVATFAIKLLFRQHASWQGCVTWLEGRQEQSFRSVLELFLLMDSAIQANEKVS